MKARDAFQLADKFYKRAQDLYAHKAIAQADLEQAESTRTQAQADLRVQRPTPSASWASPTPNRSVDKPPRRRCRCWRRWREKWWSGCVRPGSCCRPAATQCFTLSDMSTRVGPREHLPERSRLRARRRGSHDRGRSLPGRGARQDSIHRPGARSHHAHAAGAHRGLQSRRAAEEGHVRHRGGPRRRDSQRADRARCRRAARRSKHALRVHPDRQQPVRAARW